MVSSMAKSRVRRDPKETGDVDPERGWQFIPQGLRPKQE
jgi:hypothetical protein